MDALDGLGGFSPLLSSFHTRSLSAAAPRS